MKYFIRHRSLILCLFLSPLLVQCIATQQDLKSLELRLRTVNNRMLNLDKSFEGLHEETTNRANKDTVEDLQKHQAGTANSINELKTQVLQIKGQMEEHSYHYRKLQEDGVDYRDSLSIRFHDLNDGIENMRTTQDALAVKINELESRIQDNANLIRKISGELGRQKEAKATEAADRARKAANAAAKAAKSAEEAKARAVAKAKEARAASTGQPRIISPHAIKKVIKAPKEKAPVSASGATSEIDLAKKLYNSGIAAFTAKKFQDAYAAFTNYIEKYPKGDFIANARLWLADSLYAQKEYELAILEYNKVFTNYPKHSKAPEALLKQGLAFEKLKDIETAKFVYYKLGDDYPDSKEAAVGRKKLESL
ncbi:MAG: tol-pal system protein YbgF [Desulfobulbaceae bacterium]|nr:tol-pal system protein YbgF [Desulfobulbaceae bacterium]